MVRIPSIIIPSVRVGSIGPTSNIGGGGATPSPPSPSHITYLTQWKIVGNSEVHDNEIWSCGEYSEVDGKYHILVRSLGGSIADITLNEPLRKVGNVADTIEFPSGTDGKALVTRTLTRVDLGTVVPSALNTNTNNKLRFSFEVNNLEAIPSTDVGTILCATLTTRPSSNTYSRVDNTIAISSISSIMIYKEDYAAMSAQEVQAVVNGVIVIYKLATPTAELINAPQIEEADNYTCVISQGGKAVEWSSFETDSE